jgi:antitoxin ParD1/3/4
MGMEPSPMTVSVDLPPDLAEFVREQVLHGASATPEQLIEAALRQVKRSADEGLQTLLREGMDSGPPVEVTPAFWAERKRVLEGSAGAKS